MQKTLMCQTVLFLLSFTDQFLEAFNMLVISMSTSCSFCKPTHSNNQGHIDLYVSLILFT